MQYSNKMKFISPYQFSLFALSMFMTMLLTACKSSERSVVYNATGYDGIDVSRHNGVIDWKKVSKNRNIKYVFVKATEGYGHVDKNYLYNAQQAHKHHLRWVFTIISPRAVRQWLSLVGLGNRPTAHGKTLPL